MSSPNVTIEGDSAIVLVNSKMYPLEAVYSASYVFLDRAYIVLDGDPDKEIIVKIVPKTDENAELLGDEFNNELLNFSDYLTRAKETKKIREMILQRAIITNDPGIVEQQANIIDDDLDNLDIDDLDEDFLDDPEGIAIPWEEKYGKQKKEEINDSNENESQAEQ